MWKWNHSRKNPWGLCVDPFHAYFGQKIFAIRSKVYKIGLMTGYPAIKMHMPRQMVPFVLHADSLWQLDWLYGRTWHFFPIDIGQTVGVLAVILLPSSCLPVLAVLCINFIKPSQTCGLKLLICTIISNELMAQHNRYIITSRRIFVVTALPWHSLILISMKGRCSVRSLKTTTSWIPSSLLPKAHDDEDYATAEANCTCYSAKTELCNHCCLSVCHFVCLSVIFWEQDNSRMCLQILTKYSRHWQGVTLWMWSNFGVDPDPDLGSVFQFP